VSRRRRALLLLGLALLLGGLAASDVARREAALDREIGPLLPVVVARTQIAPGAPITARRLAVRRVPARFTPPGSVASAGSIQGLKAAIPIPAGAFILASAVSENGTAAPGPPIRSGERVADVTAVAPPGLVQPGTHVDVLVSREEGDGTTGQTVLALEDVEVLGAVPVSRDGAGPDDSPKVAASLRVDLEQAVYLAAAQSFARELRLLPRAAGDRTDGSRGLTVGADLGLRKTR
jgi:pilus assembly protein CpaB